MRVEDPVGDAARAVRDSMKSGDYFKKGAKAPELYDPNFQAIVEGGNRPDAGASPPRGAPTPSAPLNSAPTPLAAASKPPAAAPPGARQAKDGNWYAPVAGQPGKFMNYGPGAP